MNIAIQQKSENEPNETEKVTIQSTIHWLESLKEKEREGKTELLVQEVVIIHMLVWGLGEWFPNSVASLLRRYGLLNFDILQIYCKVEIPSTSTFFRLSSQNGYYHTRFNLWNVLIIGTPDFNSLQFMEQMNFEKTDHSNHSNEQFLPARSFSLVLPTPYAWESSIRLDWWRSSKFQPPHEGFRQAKS